MAMAEDDPNAILADLESQFEDIEEPWAESVRDFSDLELSGRFNEVRSRLIELNEMQDPRTEEGRELHSLRAAYLIEMARRHWK